MDPADVTVTRPSFGHHRALDGLRGIAVLAVVIYHFAPGLVPGGFLGVDVFFVLSGFLITSLLLVEFGADRSVSLRGFWSRRARRLLPAALCVILVSVALSWWLDPASSRTAARTQSLASLFYVNNWSAIASGSSYEAQFGHDTPLAHFWSLAVEEQFYLLFPLLIVALVIVLRRRRRSDPASLARPLLLVAVVGAGISAVLMAVLHTTDTDPSRVYFGSDTRAHALLIGVALACLHQLIPAGSPDHRRRLHPAVGLGALVVLVAAFVLVGFHQNWLYEGGLLGIAILTAAIIWHVIRTPDHHLARTLRHPLLVQLGLVSYGLYLWHWPARAFLTTARTGLDGLGLFLLRVAVTAGATALSLVLIERPFRRPSTRPDPADHRGVLTIGQASIAAAALTGVAVLCLVLTTPVHIVGATNRSAPPPSSAPADGAAGIDGSSSGPDGDSAGRPARVLLIGDSVAWTLGGGEMAFPAPETYVSPLPADRVTLWNQARFGLSLQRWPKRRNGVVEEDCPTCAPINDWRSSIEQFRPDLVVFSAVLWDTYDVRIDGTWTRFGTPEFEQAYLDRLDELRAQIIPSGARMVILLQPRPGRYPSDWSREYADDSRTFPQLEELQRRFATEHPDVGIIDLDALLCPQGACRTVDEQGRTLRSDGLHFSTEGTQAMSGPLTDLLLAQMGTGSSTESSTGSTPPR